MNEREKCIAFFPALTEVGWGGGGEVGGGGGYGWACKSAEKITFFHS